MDLNCERAADKDRKTCLGHFACTFKTVPVFQVLSTSIHYLLFSEKCIHIRSHPCH